MARNFKKLYGVIFRYYTIFNLCMCFSHMHEVFRIVSSSIKGFFFSLPLQSDADYWLLSDADVSITDMWRTERILLLDILASITSYL